VLGVAVFRRGVACVLAVVLFVVAPGLMVLPSSVAADPVVEGVVSFSHVPELSMFHSILAFRSNSSEVYAMGIDGKLWALGR
jgi:hypothetical protein